MDPLRYHAWAASLANTYHRPGWVHLKEDIYQIAMVGLLELWRQNPEAEEALCIHAMRAAVLREVQAATRQKRTAITTPIEEERTAPAPDDPASKAIGIVQAEFVWDALSSLPAKESAPLKAVLGGKSLRQWARDSGTKWGKALEVVESARRHLGMKLGIEVRFYYAVPEAKHRKPMSVHADRKCGFIARADDVEVLTAKEAAGRPRCRYCCPKEATA